MKRIGFLLAIAALSGSQGSGARQSIQHASVRCKVDRKLAALVAQSDYAVIGTMAIPTDELRRRAAEPSPDYIDIPVAVIRTVKGMIAGNIVMRFYPKDAGYKPGNAAMVALDGKPALLF